MPDGTGRFVDVTPAHQPTEHIHDAFFVDRDRGWVGFTDSGAATARLVRTDDGGRTWAPVTASTEAQDQQTAWASALSPGEPLRLYATSDGGDSWQPLPYVMDGSERQGAMA